MAVHRHIRRRVLVGKVGECAHRANAQTEHAHRPDEPLARTKWRLPTAHRASGYRRDLLHRSRPLLAGLAANLAAFLHNQLLAGLAARNGVRLLGSPQVALASFVVEGVHHSDLGHLLTEQGIAVRSGNHCAMPLMKHLGLDGATRVSLGLSNDSADLERFFSALDQALELLR